MCIRCETREKARQSLAFSRVSKPHTHITYMLRQCTSIVYIWTFPIDEKEFQFKNFFLCLSLLLFIVTYIILINMTWALRVKETREFTCLLGTISLNISLTTCHLQHLSLTVHAFLPFVQELHVMTWFRRYVVGLVFVVIKYQII